MKLNESVPRWAHAANLLQAKQEDPDNSGLLGDAAVMHTSEEPERVLASVPRSSFVFFTTFYEATEKLPKKFRYDTFKAIMRYAIYHEMPTNLNELQELVFLMAKPLIDTNQRRYENGLKGGCPKGIKKPSMIGNKNAQKTKPKQNQNETKTKPYVYVDVYEYEDEDEYERIKSLLNDKSLSKDEYLKGVDDFKKHLSKFTHVCRMAEQNLSYYYYCKLCNSTIGGAKEVDKKLLAMNNSKGIEFNKNSVLETLIQYLQNDHLLTNFTL